MFTGYPKSSWEADGRFAKHPCCTDDASETVVWQVDMICDRGTGMV